MSYFLDYSVFNKILNQHKCYKSLLVYLYYRVCVWTALLLFLLAIFNACSIITRFTRIVAELFGMLIAVLFMQEAVKVSINFAEKKQLWIQQKQILIVTIVKSQGLISEFSIPKAENTALEKYKFQWLYLNGLLAIIFSFGLLFTALKSRRARSWRYGTGK